MQLTERLIPNLPLHIALVLENYLYHNAQTNPAPTLNTWRSTKISWLNENSVSHTEELHKPDLYELIRIYKSMYHTDKIRLWTNSHSVLWLPPYHQKLYLIKLLLTTAKNWVADKNVKLRMEDMIKHAHEKFSSISKDGWIYSYYCCRSLVCHQ